MEFEATDKEKLLKEINQLREKIKSLENGNGSNNALVSEPSAMEERYVKLFESNLVGIFRTTIGGKIIECNKAHAALFGYDSIEDLKKISSVDLYFHPNDREKYLDELRKNKQLNNYKLRLKRKDGREIWVSINVILSDEKNSGEEFIEGVLIDITDSQNMGIDLKRNEERFRMLAENALDIVYRYSFFPSHGYEYVSPSVLAITGYTPEEFYADPFLGFKIIHPEDVPQIGNSEKKIKERTEVRAIQSNQIILRWVTKPGKVIWTETRSRPIYDEKGKIIAIEGISRDVTERKLAEQEIIHSEERFKVLSGATFEGIVFSENGKIIDANDQLVKMLGFDSVKELLGKNLVEEFVVSNQIEVARKLLRLPQSEMLEVSVRKKDGSIITIETKGQLIPYIGRNVKAVVVYDVSQRKKYEKELLEKERALSALMAHLPGMAYRCQYDESWTMNFISEGCLDLTGYPPKDLLKNKKLKFSELVHPEDREIGKDKIADSIRTHTSFELEYRIVTANKTVKWVWEKGEGVFDEKKDLLFIEGFITDISHKKEQEKKLKESRENYKNLIELSPDGIMIHDEKYKVIFANKSAKKIMGVKTIDELNKNTVFHYILPEYHQKVKERRKMVYKNEALAFIEIKVKRADETIVEIETKPIAIIYDSKPAIQVVMHDLSYERQLEKEQLRVKIAEETNVRLEKEIKERKNAERVLQETQKYTRLLIDSSLDMICACDKNGCINEFNSAAQRTFGYSIEEVLGKHIDMLYGTPSDRINFVDENLSLSGSFSGEVKGKKKNGEVFTAYLSASVLKNELGKTIGAMGVLRDITEIKSAQIQLEQSEERYRDLFENATDLIQSVDILGNIIYVNDAWKSTLGYSDKDIKKLNIFKVTHPEFQEYFRDVLQRVEMGETIGEIKTAFVTKNSDTVLVEGNISLKMQAGKPGSTRGIFRNVTEREKAEEEVKLQSVKLNAVIESSSHLIWAVDNNMRLTSYNKNYSDWVHRIYGAKPYIGMAITAKELVLTDAYKVFWIKKYSDTLRGNPQYFETSIADKKGNTMWREIYLNPIHRQGGQVTEVSCIGHDITEKKINDERIKHSLKEKEVLLKEVHHRVKNNMQVISSILNLQSSYVKEKKILDMFKESQNRIKSMAFIHESLYQTKDFSNTNFSEYATNLSRNLMRSYSNLENTVKLRLDIENVFLHLDQAIPCGLIINELITNSLKYAFPKNRKGLITISIKPKRGKLILSIIDNGIGLSEKINYRDTMSLGLQLVVTLVGQLNGTIKLIRKKGTKFIITFKYHQIKD